MPDLPLQRAGPGPSAPASGLSVTAIGASAGGLEACTGLLDALPPMPGTAFILVQHLDPSHESLMAELLSTHTTMVVTEAIDATPIAPGHLYVIPPACLLTVAGGLLHLERAPDGRGARLPFDTLLLSMAEWATDSDDEVGSIRIGAIVLSGTGDDGSAGVVAVAAAGGLVIAQDPAEAGYGGMPRSAVATGTVQSVLHVADMPAALAAFVAAAGPAPAAPGHRLADIVELLRTRTAHDFTLYKPGTLQRRVDRRMALAGLAPADMDGYLARLQADPAEPGLLAKDLFIHVTSFFRDPAVFDHLAETVVPALIAGQPAHHTIRVWVAGCSTGEEAYSLAIVFQERIAAAGSGVRLQFLASDTDADAVATAREGLYPATIARDVSPARLAAFFTREGDGYRVVPELRGVVVFTVQDLLADPPFSRLDVVSCRNVMIYLRAEAQRKIVTLFHFALRTGGVLLLGNSEGVGDGTGRFEVISKADRLYRRIGRSRPGEVDFSRNAAAGLRIGAAPRVSPPSRQASLAALCAQATLETHAPATVLATPDYEVLYALGPVARYLSVVPGPAPSDVLAMVDKGLRTRLRSAMLRAVRDKTAVMAGGGHTVLDGTTVPFGIEVRPLVHEGEDLLMIHFLDQPGPPPAGLPTDPARVSELERELTLTRDELQGAVRSLEISAEEQKSVNENALSINEEFQATNEELLTSKEELQSLNEELTVLNKQLQEMLEQQRTAANDLQNVLYSTDVATLFLDTDLQIRFFTPATTALFNLIKTDIGRPLADLHALAAGPALTAECRRVLETLVPIEHEVTTEKGIWSRRIMPYRTHPGTAEGAVEGVVITFADITAACNAAHALEAAKREAERANAAKSHFLAAASHDLRQPLQSLALIQGLLARRVAGTPAATLVARLEETVGVMSGMLNTLLDISQIESGTVQPRLADVPLGPVLHAMRRAFAAQAGAQGLELRIVPCDLVVHTDPDLLEQMLRNLLGNALKYTPAGRVLLGCRRAGGKVRIEVWDTGIGIPEAALETIFDEYNQLGNDARERTRGLGLGLSIVRRLGLLLGHRVAVRSRLGHGSVFGIELPRAAAPPPRPAPPPPPEAGSVAEPGPHRTGTVLVVDDDPDVRALLGRLLTEDGQLVALAPDGPAAVALAVQGVVRPDLLLTDFSLPGGLDGLAIAASLRARFGAALPLVVLTGDIAPATRAAIAACGGLHLQKPVQPAALARAIQSLLPPAALPAPPAVPATIYVVDDDAAIRDGLRRLLEEQGRPVQDFATAEAFLAGSTDPGGCILLDAALPGMGGIDLLRHLRAAGDVRPVIMVTGSSDVAMAVAAMQAGAADFIEKPVAAASLLASIDRALARAQDGAVLRAWQAEAAQHVSGLTSRQHEIMDRVLAGQPSKNIAADLGISRRTVENHRATIMKVTGARSLPALARLAIAAAAHPPPALLSG